MPRVALVGAEAEENLGLRYLAATLRHRGHRADIVAFDRPDEIREVAAHVAKGDYDLVGLSMMFQLRGREFTSLAERIRAHGFRGAMIAGGQHATFMAREILADNPALDAVVLGDGEGPIADIARALRRRRADHPADALLDVPGLWVRTETGEVVATGAREERTDLTALPRPVRDRRPRRHMGLVTAPMIASRGCYARCSFCSIVAWEKLSGGPRLRLRPPEHVAEEMAELYHRHRARVFNFHDDNFWLPTVRANLERLGALSRALEERGVGEVALLFKCRPNDVDRELFELCRDMGMVRVYVGIETDAPQGLVTLRRGVSQDQNQRALDLLAELDVHACSNLLIFDPDTTLDDFEHNVDFIERNGRYTLNYCRVEPYGGTPLTARLAAEGRLRGDYLGFDYTLREPRVELLWRMVHVAVHERNFPVDGLANETIGLAYRFHLAKRFWPSATLEAMRPGVEDFVARVAQSQVALLRRALAFVRSHDPSDRAAAVGFALELAADVRHEDAAFGAQCDALIAALEAYARMHGAGGSDGRLGEGAAGSGWWHTPRALALGAAVAAAACGPSPARPTGTGTSGGESSNGTQVEVHPFDDDREGEQEHEGDEEQQEQQEQQAHAPLDLGPVAELPPPAAETVTEAELERAEHAFAIDDAELRADPDLDAAIDRAAGAATWAEPTATTEGEGVTVEVMVMRLFIPGTSNGCSPPQTTPYLQVAVHARGEGADHYLLRHVGARGATVRDITLEADGRGASFHIFPVPATGSPRGDVFAVFVSADGAHRVVATAPFANQGGQLVAGPPVPPRPPTHEGFRGCDPVAMPTPPRVAANPDPVVHVRQSPTGLRRAGTIVLESWLDDGVRGTVTDVTATAGQGRVEASLQPDHRTARLTFDARGPDLRPAPGRVTLEVRWRVTVGGRARDFVARVVVNVRPDGVVELPSPQPSALSAREGDDPQNEVPLAERYGGRIEATRDGAGWALELRTALDAPDAQIRWRASGGRIVPGRDGHHVRFVPSRGARHPSVVVTMTVGDHSVAVASWSP